MLGILLATTISNLPPPGPAPDQDAVLQKLEKLITLDRGFRFGRDRGIRAGTTIEKALEEIGEKHTLKFRFDMRAFEAVGQPGVKAQPVRMPRCFEVRLRAVLRLLLDQADSHYTVSGDTVVIRPKGKEKVQFPPPGPLMLRREDGVRKKLAKGVVLDKGIDPNTSLEDAVEWLGDRYDLAIFVHPKHDQLCKRFVQLPPSFGASLDAVLLALLAQADAHYELWDDTLVILPGKK
jgi:hypothetical protein